MNSIFIVQTNDGFYINGVSYHSTQVGADETCAHIMDECYDDDNVYEASKYEVVERRLKV